MGISSEVVKIIYELLPGFIVAWIFYNLTAYPKPAPFERVVLALIFTVIVRAVIIITKHISFGISNWFVLGQWGNDVELVISILYAISLGLLLAWFVNNDFPTCLFRKGELELRFKHWKWIQRILSKFNLSEKTLHPTEWYSAFYSNSNYIVLNLKNGRRLYGWPKQYPDDPDQGHFIITDPEWLLDSGERAPLYTVQSMLVPASTVLSVDFLKYPSDVKVDESKIKEVEKILVSLNRKD